MVQFSRTRNSYPQITEITQILMRQTKWPFKPS